VLGIADIADELGMSRSTTHRYVITLVALGYLEQGASRKYRLGLSVTDLGLSAINATGLREHAHPHLEELRQRTSYTASVSVLEGSEVLIVDLARSYRRGLHSISRTIRVGSRVPAHCTASGKVLLAALPDRELRDFLAQAKLRKSGPNAITAKSALRAELERVREQGYAVDDEELAAGAVALAVPVREDADHVAAAMAISAASSMISPEQIIDGLLAHLVAAADHVSARLGHRRSDELS
jgi:IclR family pca regulon transcriptional regulator